MHRVVVQASGRWWLGENDLGRAGHCGLVVEGKIDTEFLLDKQDGAVCCRQTVCANVTSNAAAGGEQTVIPDKAA